MQLGKHFTISNEGLLRFNKDVVAPQQPNIRFLKDVLDVVYEKTEASDKPLYYMYRDVALKNHKGLFAHNNLRYDITVILPGRIGKEYIKTLGHFHPKKPNSTETYTEYYEIISGKAICLLQKNDEKGDVEEIIAIGAEEGDKIFIPSSYGHVTINCGDQPLVMANIVESNFQSLYSPFKERHGAAYYYIKGENGDCFIKNQNYKNNVDIKILNAKQLPQPIEVLKESSLYEAFIKHPKLFDILK